MFAHQQAVAAAKTLKELIAFVKNGDRNMFAAAVSLPDQYVNLHVDVSYVETFACCVSPLEVRFHVRCKFFKM